MMHPQYTPEQTAHFWNKVDRSGGPASCWQWLAATDRDGYGISRNRRAHRVAWALTNGPIAAGLVCCHRCDNPGCCNPAHLFLGTIAENNRDMHAKGRHIHGDTHPSRARPETRPRGSAHGRAILTEGQVEQIRRLLAGGSKGTTLAAQYGVSPSAISLIRKGKNWRHLT